ncbi:haloalkane dehalogenase [Streptomyces sp. NPDC099088]|uniref:haloalkane dehalogenase n=1 Tax=Streptomyces sp. NPDC099088 TaxID=3366101 RepID=UPI003814B1D5
MKVLRTPAERFVNLPGYNFSPNYAFVAAGDGSSDKLRVHYVDEGSAAATDTIVMLHGEPTWSYIYRDLIPLLVHAGHRCIAPDLVGFGRSDKPANRSDYTYERHIGWVRELLFEQLGLGSVTLLLHDWGGLIGLRLVAEQPERFSRVIAANTGLPTGGQLVSKEFSSWLQFSQRDVSFDIGKIVQSGCVNMLDVEVLAAYDAPFPSEAFKQGARAFPALVPISECDVSSEANRRAWESLASFERPFLCAFSDLDPLTKGAERSLQRIIPGCADRPHVLIRGAGHFLQEDCSEELARSVNSFIAQTV